jgi:hypothetical protein
VCLLNVPCVSSDDKEFVDGDVQSDDGRYSFQFDAVNSRFDQRLKSRSRSSLDDDELFAVVDWGNTSAVLVIVGAVLVTTVVAAVLALVMHTRRRMVTDGRTTTVANRNATVLNNKRERLQSRNGDNEVNTWKNTVFIYLQPNRGRMYKRLNSWRLIFCMWFSRSTLKTFDKVSSTVHSTSTSYVVSDGRMISHQGTNRSRKTVR